MTAPATDPRSRRARSAGRVGGAVIWPEEILGYGPYLYRVGHWPLDPGVGAWFGPGGCVGDPDAMRARAAGILACFEAGLCPLCGVRMVESSPGWVRCPTSYATGPRSDRTDPIEYRIVIDPFDGRPRWQVRQCAFPFDGLHLGDPASVTVAHSDFFADRIAAAIAAGGGRPPFSTGPWRTDAERTVAMLVGYDADSCGVGARS